MDRFQPVPLDEFIRNINEQIQAADEAYEDVVEGPVPDAAESHLSLGELHDQERIEVVPINNDLL